MTSTMSGVGPELDIPPICLPSLTLKSSNDANAIRYVEGNARPRSRTSPLRRYSYTEAVTFEQAEGQNGDSNNGVTEQKSYIETRPRSKTSPEGCDLETRETRQAFMPAIELQLVIVMAIKETKKFRGEKGSNNLRGMIEKVEQKNWINPRRDGLGRRLAVCEEVEDDRDMLYRIMMNVLNIKNSKCLA